MATRDDTAPVVLTPELVELSQAQAETARTRLAQLLGEFGSRATSQQHVTTARHTGVRAAVTSVDEGKESRAHRHLHPDFDR